MDVERAKNGAIGLHLVNKELELEMVNLASVDRCNLESKEYTILYLWVRRNRIVK